MDVVQQCLRSFEPSSVGPKKGARAQALARHIRTFALTRMQSGPMAVWLLIGAFVQEIALYPRPDHNDRAAKVGGRFDLTEARQTPTRSRSRAAALRAQVVAMIVGTLLSSSTAAGLVMSCPDFAHYIKRMTDLAHAPGLRSWPKTLVRTVYLAADSGPTSYQRRALHYAVPLLSHIANSDGTHARAAEGALRRIVDCAPCDDASLDCARAALLQVATGSRKRTRLWM